MQTFEFFNNTGGLNLRSNDLSLAPGEAEEITNLHATTQGSWSSLNIGYVNVNTSALGSGQPVQSLYEYHTLSGQVYLMVVAGSQLYTFNEKTGESTLLYSELTANRPMNFVTFQGLLIGCNGADNPIKWDGENPVENLANWPPSILFLTPGPPAISEIFSNRLIFSGDESNPSLLYISALEDAENFEPAYFSDSAGALQVSPGDGEKITGLKTLFLPVLNQEVLVVFKERSTYILSGNDVDNFALQKVSDEFGAVSHRAVCLVGNELMFLSADGITSLSTATAQGNITTQFLSNRIQALIESLNRNVLSNSFSVHLRNRQEVWWFVPEGSATQNQTVLVYNYGVNKAWSKRSGIVAACGISKDAKLFTGTNNGFVQQQLKGNTYNGQPIRWTYRTGFQDFSQPRLRKRLREIQLFLKQISALTLTVNFYWDFKRGSQARQSRVYTLVPDNASSTYGQAVYGQAYYSRVGSSSVRVTPPGSGQYFQLELTAQSVNEPVEIEGWTITPIYGGPR